MFCTDKLRRPLKIAAGTGLFMTVLVTILLYLSRNSDYFDSIFTLDSWLIKIALSLTVIYNIVVLIAVFRFLKQQRSSIKTPRFNRLLTLTRRELRMAKWLLALTCIFVLYVICSVFFHNAWIGLIATDAVCLCVVNILLFIRFFFFTLCPVERGLVSYSKKDNRR